MVPSDKNGKLHRTGREKYIGTAGCRKALGLQTYQQEAGVHRDGHEGGREELAAWVPGASTRTHTSTHTHTRTHTTDTDRG